MLRLCHLCPVSNIPQFVLELLRQRIAPTLCHLAPTCHFYLLDCPNSPQARPRYQPSCTANPSSPPAMSTDHASTLNPYTGSVPPPDNCMTHSPDCVTANAPNMLHADRVHDICIESSCSQSLHRHCPLLSLLFEACLCIDVDNIHRIRRIRTRYDR